VLLAYPPIKTGTNWLHDCLMDTLAQVHDRLRAGKEPPAWPEIIPDLHRNRIRSRSSLREGISKYVTASRTLSDPEHDQALRALAAQNQIEKLLAGEVECERMEALPAAIRQPLLELYEVAFRQLRELGVRDVHEACLIAERRQAICPFCGCEYFEPSGVRADLDHYLTRTIYPYASANLENLVPMGKYCNQGFKGQTDLLYDDDRRCIAYFPFGAAEVATIDLDRSDPLGDSRRPSWVVRLDPPGGRTETWDRVFGIRTRFVEILRREYSGFLSEFYEVCRFRGASPPVDKPELVKSLKDYVELQRRLEMSDKAFLKAAVFKMLLKHCREGNDDLVELLLAGPLALS
jgi:hypothetical protein